MTTLPARIDERAIARPEDLEPYLAAIERYEPATPDDAQRKLEAALALDAIATARRWHDALQRTKAQVVKSRAIIGEMQEDARPGRSGKTSDTNDVLSRAQRDARHTNNKLGADRARTERVVDALVAAGETPSLRRVLAEVNKTRVADTRATPPPAPEMPRGEYGLLYADPPWRYDGSHKKSRAMELQYPTMTTEAICDLKVPAAKDCVLFLWATTTHLPEALMVMQGWGFRYRTSAVGAKDRAGMGNYFRVRHELILIGTRGKPGTPASADMPDSIVEAPRGAHSTKPAIVRELIERMYPDHPRVELFAREAPAGWDTWGTEVPAAGGGR